MSEVNKEFWALMNEFRGEKFDLLKIIRAAKQRGINIDFSTLRSLSHSWRDAAEYFLPESIPNFVISILKDFHPRTILDPWANTGSLLSPITEFFTPEKALGITLNQSSLEIAQLLIENENITWKLEDPFNAIDDIKGDLDLIASAPPFGLNRKVSFSEEVGLKDDFGNLLILKACQRLKDHGVGIFIVAPSFFIDKRLNTVKGVLSEYDLYLDAAFLLPHGTFEPITSINTYLIVIRRSKVKKLFVGQIFGNEQQDALLLQNYRERRAGKIPQQGILVDENEFKGLDVLITAYEIDQMVMRSGLFKHPLSDITIAINLPKRAPEAEFTEATNAVYLPIIGKSPVVTSIEDFTIKPQNYAQILFDDNKAFGPYVAKFLNSRLGLKIRESLAFGFVIPKITKSALETSLIYLPKLQTQKEAVRINADITNLSAELASLQNELWEFPNKTTKIESNLRRFSQEKGWEIWMEELPFPIASILWAYLATVDAKDKLDHISHFFEASIQFLVMICLSALAQDKEYYQLNQKAWNTENPKYKGWYKNASFGSWLSLQSSLAKFIRVSLPQFNRHN